MIECNILTKLMIDVPWLIIQYFVVCLVGTIYVYNLRVRSTYVVAVTIQMGTNIDNQWDGKTKTCQKSISIIWHK